MTPLRTLPIRVAPLPGEALDSWLEALAYRMHMPVGALLHSVGLNRRTYPRREGAPQGRNWMNGLQPDEASVIASVTGAAEATLTSMTLAAYDGRALVIDPSTRQVRKGILWGRNAGSRYCPSCLAESGGRWSLTWRLGWSFACLRHQCLLADTCPRCSRLQRMYRYRAERLLHPAYCGYPAVRRTTRTRCETDLRETTPVFLGPGHPALNAQRLILEAIEAGEARFGVYAATPLPTRQALADVKAIAARALADASSSGLSSRLPADIRDLYEQYLIAQPQESRNLRNLPRVASVAPGRMSPPRAVTAAAGVLAAIEVLGQPSIASAGLSLRWLTSGTRSRGQAATPTTVAAWSRGASTAMNAVALYSLQPVLRPSDQLRYRVVSPSPQVPDVTGDRIAAVARSTPGLLWESWAVRIAVPEVLGRSLRAALPVLVLITGTRTSLGEAAALLGNVISKTDASRILGVLHDAAQWLPVLTAITRLSDYLESRPAPIDYKRRRSLDYSGLLPGVEWDQICRATGTPPGSGRKEKVARAYLRERVSMLPYDVVLPGAGFRFREELASFLFLLFPEFSAQLDQEALRHLATQGITGEPVTWHPPLDLIADLTSRGLTRLPSTSTVSTGWYTRASPLPVLRRPWGPPSTPSAQSSPIIPPRHAGSLKGRDRRPAHGRTGWRSRRPTWSVSTSRSACQSGRSPRCTTCRSPRSLTCYEAMEYASDGVRQPTSPRSGFSKNTLRKAARSGNSQPMWTAARAPWPDGRGSGGCPSGPGEGQESRPPHARDWR